jgi:phosphoribosylglycinamide formyltransferase-1
MKRIVVLLSGGGSNLQAVIDHCKAGKINGNIVAVISNRPNVMGLQRAVKAGINAITVDHKNFGDRESFDEALKHQIDFFEPDIIVLAGFMRILTEPFVNHYVGKMVNIHPSLLPKYPGLNTHERALAANDDIAGATVHFVTPELDGGPLIAFSESTISKDDDVLSLSKKVLSQEHLLYPAVIQWLCNDRLTFAEGLPNLDGETLSIPINFNSVQ